MNTLITVPRARIILEVEVGIRPADLSEATVRLPPRSTRWIAVYTGPDGGQVVRSTGLRDRGAALGLARRWERVARLEREAKRAAGGRLTRQRTGDALPSQSEVAQLLGLSTRGVRGIEQRALRKLRRALHQIMPE